MFGSDAAWSGLRVRFSRKSRARACAFGGGEFPRGTAVRRGVGDTGSSGDRARSRAGSPLGLWSWLLIWPAASLALIAAAYARGNSAVFRKKDGRLPISTRVVLGPYLCGAVLSRLIYRRHGEPWIEAAPGVHCGRLLTNREALAMNAMGITGVLDLTAEQSETRALQAIEYSNVPVLDLTEPSREQVDAAVAFITKHARRGGVLPALRARRLAKRRCRHTLHRCNRGRTARKRGKGKGREPFIDTDRRVALMIAPGCSVAIVQMPFVLQPNCRVRLPKAGQHSPAHRLCPSVFVLKTLRRAR